VSSTALGALALVAGLAVGACIAAVLVRRHSPDGAVLHAETARMQARLEVQTAELRRLADAAGVRDQAAEHLRAEVSGARRALDEIALREGQRRERERRDSEVIRRLSTVLAGGPGKGRAGENVLREHLSELPPGMLVTDFRVNGKVVEFGLLLPDGRRLPIDSKWSALSELEALEAADDDAREACAREVERVVALRAREVAQYLDPSLTAPVAVAAIPDAAYSILHRAHADAYAKGVIIVPYSSALPILLFLYSLTQRFGEAGDMRACLAEVSSVLDGMEGVLENKMARASAMLAHGADEFRSQLGKARGSLARAHGSEDLIDVPALRAVEVE
jgi:DNA recombination protein RmuC